MPLHYQTVTFAMNIEMDVIGLHKVLESKIKIRFQDCDPFNHLNNASYINYFLNAREDQLMNYYDLDIYKFAKETGEGWVVASNQIRYVNSVQTMETVVVQSQIFSFSDRSLCVEMKMFDEQKKQLKAVLWSKFVFINMRKRCSTEHPEEFMTLFENVLCPIDAVIFEERIQSLLPRK